MEIRVVNFSREIFDLTSLWLQNMELRTLIDAPIILPEQEREEWFLNLNDRSDYLIKGLLVNERPVGVIGFKNINTNSAEYFGYIGTPELWGQGIGKQMMKYAFEIARSSLRCTSIWLKVLKDNQRALKSYKKMGFVEKSSDDRLVYMQIYL